MELACFVYKPVALYPFISPLRKHVHGSCTCKTQNVLTWCTNTFRSSCSHKPCRFTYQW